MIKRVVAKTALLKRLEQLEEKVQIKDSTPMVLDLEQWLNSDSKSPSFAHEALMLGKKHPTATIIMDTMIIEPENMYLDTGLILISDRRTIQSFMNLEDEVEYMKRYIEVFDAWIGIDDLESKSEYIKKLSYIHDKSLFADGRYWTKEEQCEASYQARCDMHGLEIQTVREVLSELSEPFLLDFFEHYKKLSVEELIIRYKDRRFFEPQPLK